MKKAILATLTIIMLLALAQTCLANNEVYTEYGGGNSTLVEPQLPAKSGDNSTDTSIYQMSGDVGSDYIIKYGEVSADNFTFSLDVTADILQGFALMLRGDLPFAGSTNGCNLEFGARNGGSFTLAWFSNTSGWTWHTFAPASEKTTYTLILDVKGYNVTAIISNEGVTVGVYSVIVPVNFNYYGYGVLESGGNYTVTNIQLVEQQNVAVVQTSPEPSELPLVEEPLESTLSPITDNQLINAGGVIQQPDFSLTTVIIGIVVGAVVAAFFVTVAKRR